MSKAERDFSFKKLILFLTTSKAIHIVVVVGFIVYFNSLFNGFTWDDVFYIQQNPEVHTLNITTLFSKNTLFNDLGYYRPISALYFATIYTIFGGLPLFFHLIQVSLHIVVAYLLYILLIGFFPNDLAMILSLIFLVHPMNVESVAHICAALSELFSLFGLLALLLSRNAKTIQSFVLISFLLLLALLTKEVAAVFFFLILLYQIFFTKKNIRVYIAIETIVIVIYGVLRLGFAVSHLKSIVNVPIAKLTLLERLMNIPAIILYYLKTLVFPTDLSVAQNWLIIKMSMLDFYFPLFLVIVFVVSLTGIGVFIYKQKPKLTRIYLFFILWFLGGMVFLLQLFPLDMTVSDRWFYLPMMGLLGVLGVVVSLFPIRGKRMRLIGGMLVIVLLCIFALRSMVRNTNWADDFTLFSHDSTISDDYNKEDSLALIYSDMGSYDLALTHALKSVSYYSTWQNLTDLGVIYQFKGDYKKAKETYYKAINANIYIRSN